MGITKYLPNFKSVEMNRSTGLVTGHVLSQYPAALDITRKTVGDTDFVENGLIVGLNNDLTIGNFDKTKHNEAFIVFTEELNTFLSGLKYFANEEDENGEIYLRAVALKVGDTWTTDNFDGELKGAKFAKVVDGVITMQTVADDDTLFAVEESTMPLGQDAARVTFLGIKPIAEEVV